MFCANWWQCRYRHQLFRPSLGLTIDNVTILVSSSEGKFSASIPFDKGLNIIRAENTSGKSTCVNAIVYALGLEAVLGPSRKRPFPKSLYEIIHAEKGDKRPYSVIYSYVSVKVTNGSGVSAVIKRDVKGESNKVKVDSSYKGGDYFLGSSGSVGSQASERGFHYWLSEFIGWDLPQVVTFEGKPSRLYLECIFPLLFIEQKRGWSEIQANTPTHYKIKNVKKSAVEFSLGIDSFEYERKVAALKKKAEDLESEWATISANAEGVADFNSVRIDGVSELKKGKEFALIDFKYSEGNTLLGMAEQERSLKRYVEELDVKYKKGSRFDDSVKEQASIVGVVRRDLERVRGQIEVEMVSLSDLKTKLDGLRYEHNQYGQLKRLKTVGVDISADLDVEKCPICEGNLYDSLGEIHVKRKPMGLEENIDFLKSQIEFFDSVKDKTLSNLKMLQREVQLYSSRLDEENKKLADLKAMFDDADGESKALLKEKLEAQILLDGVLKLKVSKDDINASLKRVHTAWNTTQGSLETLKGGGSNANRAKQIEKLQTLLRKNIEAFGFNAPSYTITISEQTLRPEQEGYDIVAETSASDYIRIIWAYTLALLELGGKDKEVKHGGFVVFDEPRQHEASKVSFANLIGKASLANKYGGQVIFATSLDEAELDKACVDVEKVKIHRFEDYILTLEG